MKIAILFDSKTGNTKKVAEAIQSVVPPQQLVYFGPPCCGVEADLYFVGSWTDKGLCAQPVGGFLQELQSKKIAYFGTAGFLSEEYAQKLQSRIAGTVGNNQLLGCFFCQGKMPMSVRERYVQIITENPEDQKVQASLKNFDEALSHPDAADLQNARNWAASLLNQ